MNFACSCGLVIYIVEAQQKCIYGDGRTYNTMRAIIIVVRSVIAIAG